MPVEKKRTPLPKLQLFNLIMLQLAEPITSQCIYPFLNQLISELPITGGDPRKVGYYAGMIQSSFFATEALFTLHWSMLSDRIGRKPVLMIGIAGLCISMLLFGLSTTFTQLLLSRCLVGMLNGNTGVMKSMMGEITDSSNMAQAFALMPIVWSLGSTFAPMMGGQLAKPHERWPNVFSGQFWIEYPYFLPCAGSAAFSALVFLNTAFLLKEPSKARHRKRTDSEASDLKSDAPLPFRKVLIWPVIISVVNYGILALFDIAFFAILPLFYATPLSLGGLQLSPAEIGIVMGLFGLVNGSFQACFFARLVDWLGPKRMYMTGMSAFPFIFALFPVISEVAKSRGISPVVWALVALQLVIATIMDCSYGTIFMYVTSAAPNKKSLGATNGLGQVIASVLRAVGPATATSLFAISMERNWLGGYAVFLILAIAATLALYICNMLPSETWHRDEDD
ncbi:MFS general substrate transporter [Panus rudis PR-1116 ss-1]|nr:MFS general substrate transporter [Panus rudis PR-1116 ss-1]